MPDFDYPRSVDSPYNSQVYEDLLVRLASDDLRKVLTGESMDLAGKALAVRNATAGEAWKILKLVHLLNAAAHLCLGAFERITIDFSYDADSAGAQILRADQVPPLLEVLRAARERDFICQALRSFRAGGPSGLFQAYEALTNELMRIGASDYSRGVGTREWLAENGWASVKEIDTFLKTVLRARTDVDVWEESNAISPLEAEAFVRRLLLRFIRESTSGSSNSALTRA